MARKIKSKLTLQEYKRLYPSDSYPGKFHGTAKLHKIDSKGLVGNLPIRLKISDINTSTYNLSKHLARLLTLLRENKYNTKSTKDFMNKINNKKVSNGYQMVSFDAKSLFTNVPLDRTIQLVLKRIDEKHETSANITKQDMKEMPIPCTKNAHFTFNEEVYKQTDGVEMRSPIGPVLADIFMVELENNIVPVLQKNMSFWKQYVDDTICFVKIGPSTI